MKDSVDISTKIDRERNDRYYIRGYVACLSFLT